MARIASIGSALQDIYLVDHDDLVPTSSSDKALLGKLYVGSKVDIDKIFYEVGGGGINSSISFARHNHESIFIGNVGDDAASEAIFRTLDRESVDTSYINHSNRLSTGTSVVLLDTKSGERTILTCRGASKKFDNLDANDLDTILPDWLYITTMRGDLETLTAFLKKAKKLDVKVMFNPGVKELEKPQDILRLLKYVNILILNKSEATKLVPGTTLIELANHLNGYVETVIITDGAMGGIATNRHETYRFGIYEEAKIKDTTGAGDAFGSGFLAHLAAGNTFKSSLEFGAANSTSVIQKMGANAGILTGREKLHPMPIQKLN